jgi:hypothetical protein
MQDTNPCRLTSPRLPGRFPPGATEPRLEGAALNTLCSQPPVGADPSLRAFPFSPHYEVGH